ncbi:hypothetical protein KID03_00175 [bacterium]|nr:hypothetical protein [bacterium]
MKKTEILKYLKDIKIDLKMQAALTLLNSRRELDESNISLSFQHRDRIKRVGKEIGLDIDFVSNKLIFKSPVGLFEIKNYTNKKKVSTCKDINGVCQLSMFYSEDCETVLESKPLEIGYSFDEKRLKYTNIFFQYTAVNMNLYSVDLMNISSMTIDDRNNLSKPVEDTEQVDDVPKFIKAKINTNKEFKKVKE